MWVVPMIICQCQTIDSCLVLLDWMIEVLITKTYWQFNYLIIEQKQESQWYEKYLNIATTTRHLLLMLLTSSAHGCGTGSHS